MDSANVVDTVPAKTAPRTAVAGYSKIEAGLADLRARYANAVFDVRSAKGMAEARAARGTLRDTRLLLERTRVDEKADALAYGRLVDSEAKRIEAAIVALEDPIALQVQTEDNRKEVERKAKADAETARLASVQRRIDWIRALPVEAVGKLSGEILTLVESLDSLPILPDLYAEHVEAAQALRADVRARLLAMFTSTQAQESEVVRLKEAREALEADQRAANEKRQREDKERAERIAKEDADRAAAQKIEDDERARLRKIDEDARAATKAEQDRKDADARAEQRRKDDEAAAQRKRERDTLEELADPWYALAKIGSIATDKRRDPVGALMDCANLSGAVLKARDALAELDKAPT